MSASNTIGKDRAKLAERLQRLKADLEKSKQATRSVQPAPCHLTDHEPSRATTFLMFTHLPTIRLWSTEDFPFQEAPSFTPHTLPFRKPPAQTPPAPTCLQPSRIPFGPAPRTTPPAQAAGPPVPPPPPTVASTPALTVQIEERSDVQDSEFEVVSSPLETYQDHTGSSPRSTASAGYFPKH